MYRIFPLASHTGAFLTGPRLEGARSWNGWGLLYFQLLSPQVFESGCLYGRVKRNVKLGVCLRS